MERDAAIFLAGHRGMVGSALYRVFEAQECRNVITADRDELDLRDGRAVADFFARHRPQYVFMAAARVGGIKANVNFPGEFVYDNLAMQTNVIHQAYLHGVSKLMFIGSSCVYPRECPQPIKEEFLMTGPLEPTNEGYAIAKLAGIKMVQGYRRQYGFPAICPMPCNLYGPRDSFDLEKAHVLSALVRKFVDAQNTGRPQVVCWGSGTPRREFLHVDDLAHALLFLMDAYDSDEIINVGSGIDLPIRDLAALISERVGYRGDIVWDTTMPDGMPRKCLDVTRITDLGFRPGISLEEGIDRVIAEYRELVERDSALR